MLIGFKQVLCMCNYMLRISVTGKQSYMYYFIQFAQKPFEMGPRFYLRDGRNRAGSPSVSRQLRLNHKKECSLFSAHSYKMCLFQWKFTHLRRIHQKNIMCEVQCSWMVRGLIHYFKNGYGAKFRIYQTWYIHWDFFFRWRDAGLQQILNT